MKIKFYDKEIDFVTNISLIKNNKVQDNISRPFR